MEVTIIFLNNLNEIIIFKTKPIYTPLKISKLVT